MTERISKAQEEDLRKLSQRIMRMGGLAEAQLALALEAVARHDLPRAERAVKADASIDGMERKIDERAVRFLALRQPMARDLREAVAALKLSTDIERIGDLAKNIAKRVLATQDTRLDEPPVRSIVSMGRLVQKQLKSVLDAYTTASAEQARRVWLDDGEVDEAYNAVFRELLTYMMEDQRKIGACTHLLFMAKNIERIGDHTTNIAETVIYMIGGRMPRSPRPKRDTTSLTPITLKRQ